MIRVSIGRCFFALIKANKPPTSHNVTARQIDTCRNILAMPPCQHSDLKLKAEAYLKERAKIPSPRISAPTIYNSWQHSNPLQCEIAVLSFSKTMSASQDQYLRKVIEQWADFIFQENQKFKGKKGSLAERESFRAVLIEFFEALNSLCYLLDMDGLMINTYLRIYDLARGWKVEDKSYSHLRYVLDQLLKLEKIPQNYLQFMVSFTSRYPLQSVYHQKEKEIIGLIHKSLPQLGRQKRSHHQLLMNVLHNITILSDVPGNMKSLALNIYQNFSSYNLRLKAFCTLIDIFVIDAKNIAKYLPVIRIFLTQLANIAFKQLPLLFYRADIWLPEFWLPYFEYVSTGGNYKVLDKYHHFVIDDLLAEGGIGGKDIQEAALKFRQVLREKGIVIREFDLRKEYERSYGRIKDNKSSCQMHVANSMRLICSSQILTQVPIKYFMVDVLIDQRVVVEINNSQHYKTVDGKAFLNLKSQFRQRVLQRNGYKYYNIRVDDFASSNFSMLQDIYAIVDSTKSLPNIKKQ